jgi:hypothetical protein
MKNALVSTLLLVFFVGVDVARAEPTLSFQVRLGASLTKSIILECSDSEDYTNWPVTLDGEGFNSSNQTLYFWSFGTNTPKAELYITFQPTRPGSHIGTATVDLGGRKIVVYLSGFAEEAQSRVSQESNHEKSTLNIIDDRLIVGIEGEVSVGIYSSLGQELLKSEERVIALSTLPSGMYYAVVLTPIRKRVLKFLK